MPTLVDDKGNAVDTEGIDVNEVNRRFDQAMNADPQDGELPKRAAPKVTEDPDKPKARRGRPPKAEQARVTTSKAAGGALSDEARATGVRGWAQIFGGVFAMFGRATGNVAFAADAVTIASAADEAASACVQVAHADPRFAAALDRVCSVGPYGALISVGVGVGAQVMRNHRPGAEIPGTVHPDKLLADAQPAAA